jgi:hypothetical protein
LSSLLKTVDTYSSQQKWITLSWPLKVATTTNY